jgi:hypothetical protein
MEAINSQPGDAGALVQHTGRPSNNYCRTAQIALDSGIGYCAQRAAFAHEHITKIAI